MKHPNDTRGHRKDRLYFRLIDLALVAIIVGAAWAGYSQFIQ